MLPAIISIRVVEDGKRKLWLWLPMFVLWPVVICLLTVAFVFVYIACLVSGAFMRGALLFPMIGGLFQVFGSMRGLKTEIRNEHENSLVDIKIL
jgi:hypothetical protein